MILYLQNINISSLDDPEFTEKTTSIVLSYLFSPWVSFALFCAVLLVLVGIFFRFYRLIAASGLAVLVITVFRMFAAEIFGSYSLFKLKILLPLFALALCSKLTCDYIIKKRDELFEEETPTKRRRIKNSSSASFSKSKFAAEERSNDPSPFSSYGSQRDDKPAAPIKIQRPL